MRGLTSDTKGFFLKIKPYEDGNEPIVYIGKNNVFLKRNKPKFLSHGIGEYLDKQDIEKYSFYDMAEAIYYSTIYADDIKRYINKINKDIITTRYLSNKISIVLCSNNMPDVRFDHFEMLV